jgi:hypothetical protein
MKRSGFFLSIIIVGLAWLMSACGDSNNTNDTRPIMTCMVNSTNWRCPDPHARISENSITVYGTSANGQTIQLIIRAGEKDEYNLNELTGHEGIYIPNMSSGVVSYTTSGSSQGTGRVLITSISEDTKTISGIFNFKAFRPSDGSYKTITEGNFSRVPYKFINTVDTTIYVNELSAVIDGESWVPNSVSAVKNDTAIIITGDLPQSWESMKIILPRDIASGVHYITADGPVYALFQQGFYTFPAASGSSTVGLHNVDEQHISGTFFYNYLDNDSETIMVNSGIFDVYYNDQTIGQ